MNAINYLLLAMLAPQIIADRKREALRRKCYSLVIQDRGAVGDPRRGAPA